eukprot:6196097-Pleurochrysis_carterae.AAC.4
MRPTRGGESGKVARLLRSSHACELEELHAAVVALREVGALRVQCRLLLGQTDERVVKHFELGP